jgi:hypothetical protein
MQLALWGKIQEYGLHQSGTPTKGRHLAYRDFVSITKAALRIFHQSTFLHPNEPSGGDF